MLKKRVRKSNRKVKIGSIIILIVLFFVGTVFLTNNSCAKGSRFDLSDSAQFYIVASDQITGFKMEDGRPSTCVDSQVKVLKKNVNYSVQRTELENRYLLFTDDAWPLGRDEGIISVDFDEGIIRFLKTKHNAYTAAGSTGSFYFANSSSTEESSIWVYTPDLKEVDAVTLDPPAIMANFKADSSPFLFTGTAVNLTEDSSGNQYFKDYVYSGEMVDGKFKVQNLKELETNDYCQYWFQDTIYRNGFLYALSPGYRVHENHQRVSEGTVYRYNPETGSGEFISLETPEPKQMFDLENGLVAIIHRAEGFQPAGVTIFNLETDEQFSRDGLLKICLTTTESLMSRCWMTPLF